MLNFVFNRSPLEVKKSETDTFDQAKTSDKIVLSENGLHAERPKKDGYGYRST